MALSGTLLKRLPLTTALLYLLAGAALGPWGAGLIRLHPVRSAALFERATELAVIVSLFTAGLKLRISPFGLTGEAGLNDGTAFPFVLLGLGSWACTTSARF